MNQADANGVPAALLRFQAALGGLGRIGGPQREDGRIDLYRWEVSSRSDVEALLRLLAPWLGKVKLQELATATQQTSPPSSCASVSDEWRAWAAGLFDGEGSLYLLDHRTHPGYRIPEMCVTQSSGDGIPEVLARFASILHVGHINGPYAQREPHLPVYRWKSGSRAHIEQVTGAIWPWLGVVKREQAAAVLDVLLGQPALPRGRREWGNRKTHCIHGHEYATARMRPYISRGKGVPRRDSEQCLVCVRDYARKQREKKRTTC